jgi:hypothetical protein
MWRLVEIGEVIEKGDEYWQFGEWTKWPIGSTPTVKYVTDPVRRWAGEKKPAEPAVSVGDRVEVVSGTWVKSHGTVLGILPMNLKIKLENVFVGGSPLVFIVGKNDVAALKSAPKADVQVDPEWRMLEIGEVIREGDEEKYFGWTPYRKGVFGDTIIGRPLDRVFNPVRRRVRLQSPEWRYLDSGETVQAGDDAFVENAVFVSLPILNGSKVGNERMFRRKTAPFAG